MTTPEPLHLTRILAHAAVTFGNAEKASNWLHTPQTRFGGRTAMDVAATAQGALLVEEALVQIDEGYFA